MTTDHEDDDMGSTDELLRVVRGVWRERDPVPEGMVARMQTAAALGASDLDLDLELMMLVERSDQLAGARSDTSTFTLRFGHGDTELLLRIGEDGDVARIDGWVVPPLPMSVTAVGADGSDLTDAVAVAGSGRFELSGLPRGLTRLRLVPDDPERAHVVTPTFEI